MCRETERALRLRHRSESLARRIERLRISLGRSSNAPHWPVITQELRGVVEDVVASDCSDEEVLGLVQNVETSLTHIPQTCVENGRFFFDAALIQGSTEVWHGAGVAVSRMIVPKFGPEWAHAFLYLPSFDRDRMPRVDLVTLPGEDSLDDIFLADYPWLYHELGHILLDSHGEKVIDSFRTQMDTIVRARRIRSTADSAVNRTRAESMLKNMMEHWDPAYGNWVAEVAADIISLWICGPAFLTAFRRILEREEPNPYLLNRSHPPYDVRVSALVLAASKLGWAEYTAPLAATSGKWQSSCFAAARTNEYIAYTSIEIVQAAVSSSAAMCQALELPKCDTNSVAKVQETLRSYTLDFGPDLVVAAWLMHENVAAETYESWQYATISTLLDTVMR